MKHSMKTIMKKLVPWGVTLGLLATVALPATAGATNLFKGVDCSNPKVASSAVCHDRTSTNPVTGSHGILLRIVQLIAAFAGAVAVIIIVVAGFRFVTSEGDPQKTSAARSAIIYALVGGIIIILSASIISFVIGRV